jgi:hypothetical protein
MAWRRAQSHFGQLRQSADTGAEADELANAGRQAGYARRARLRAAVLETADPERWTYRAAAESVATGTVADVRDDFIAIHSGRGTEIFATSTATVTWMGARTTLSDLRRGDAVTVRHAAADPGTPARRRAEQIWARIGRVTGTIIAAEGRELLVDTGRPGQPPRRVVLAAAFVRPIQVRFPRLAPGYLLDVIGTRHGNDLLAVAPATAQPPYRAGHGPAPPAVSGPLPVPVSGSAVWHEPGDEPPGLLGLGYPALDPETDPETGQETGATAGPGCVRLPYLSLGSAVRVGNECAGRSAVLPVTSDGALARQFCDRCVDCATSPRGRVADLTMAAFVELGGNLEKGCFSATLTVAG